MNCGSTLVSFQSDVTLICTGLAMHAPDLEVINLSWAWICLESIDCQASNMRTINFYLSVLDRTEDFSETDFCEELFFI